MSHNPIRDLINRYSSSELLGYDRCGHHREACEKGDKCMVAALRAKLPHRVLRRGFTNDILGMSQLVMR